MTTTLDTVLDEVRKHPIDTQEVVGRFVQAALAGQPVTLEQVENQYRDERTRAGLADVEAGRYQSVEIVKQELNAKVAALRA